MRWRLGILGAMCACMVMAMVIVHHLSGDVELEQMGIIPRAKLESRCTRWDGKAKTRCIRWSKGALQGEHHLDWRHFGRMNMAAADPLNGKPLLVPDEKHPGYVVLSEDAKLRRKQYTDYLRKHPGVLGAPGLTFPEKSLSNLDVAEQGQVRMPRSKLSRMGVNV